MIGTAPDDRQTKRDVHAGLKGMKLQRNESLIVIHAEHPVPMSCDRLVEDGVRRDGTEKSRPTERVVAGEFGDGGFDVVDFLAAEAARFPGVRV